ncbi:MAG: hypothetical protein ACE5HE_03285 [Phycisphaerae bacterium]
MRRHWISHAFHLVAVFGSLPALAAASADEVKPVAADVAAAVPSGSLDVRLAPIEGFSDDAAYIQSVSARAAELALQAEATTDQATRTDLFLAAANVILARELEPACVGKLLGFEATQLSQSEADIRAALERADAMLVQADASLEAVRELSDPPMDWVSEAEPRLRTLGAFAHASAAYLLPGDGPEAADAADRAAARLAGLLEDTRPQVAAAAALWQASLKAQQDDSSRAMAVLGLVLSRPREGTMPFAFFARLLRCRILASRGGYAAALALLTQLEERCDSWFRSEQDRVSALQAIAYVTVRTLRAWQDDLSGPADEVPRRWCADRADALVKAHFEGGHANVLRLGAAVPIVAVPENAGRHLDGEEEAEEEGD